jgi:phage baseplate assembly protein W
VTGIHSTTGKALSGIDHLKQSITDILTTPIGSRVMRPNYGSRLFELIDHPLNAPTLLDFYAATTEALSLWEPRILIEKIKAESIEPGSVTLTLQALYIPTGERLTLEGITVQ